MENKNSVFIARSLDGYIADKSGGIDWLHEIPNPNHIDMGYGKFMSNIDAVVMGRITFETVCNFGIDWPYTKPVFVLSHSITNIPEDYKGKIELVKGSLKDIIASIHNKNLYNLYIDGGQTIQSFLKEDLIHEMTITTIPSLLGGGTPLFGELPKALSFECIESKIYLDKIVQNRYIRRR